ncbi:MAG: hypothetical protein QXF58_04215 [Desulfurococcaceae archaeon]
MGYRVEIINGSNNKKLVLRKVQSVRCVKVKDGLMRFGIPGTTSEEAQIADLTFGYFDLEVTFTLQQEDDIDGSTCFTSIPAMMSYIFSDFFTTQNIGVTYTFKIIRNETGQTAFEKTGAIVNIDISFDAGKGELATGTLRFMVGTVLG